MADSSLRFSTAIRLIAAAILAVVASRPLPAPAAAPLEGTKPAQWRVVWTADPATSATVSWSTVDAGTTHTLAYRPKGTDAPFKTVEAASGRYTGSETLHYHHVRLDGLEPETAYEVRMTSDQQASPILYFVTAPDTDRPFSLFHGGDSRSDPETRRQVNTMLARIVAESNGNDNPADDVIGFAHGGDYIASGEDMSQWSQWLSDHELTTTKDGRLLPVIPARGNHDRGEPFNEVFGFPAEDENYYAFNIGSEVRFVTLNSEISTAGDQAEWLQAELKQSRPNNRWLLAQYHRPAFPAVKGPSTTLVSWVPLFEQYNVDLVCEADGHVMKRTVPIRGGQQDETGVVYIGEGGLGVKQRTPKTDRWFLQSPGMAGSAHHVFVLTFEKDRLTTRCVRLDGGEEDTYTRKPRSR